MRLLVVEDDRELCRGIAFQLKKAGYEYDICHDGKEALCFARQNYHDLFILDRMIPEIDGLTLLEKIRELGINAPVIMVTALNGIHDRVDGLDAGADDYLVKPYDMEELLARIRALLRRPSSYREIQRLKVGDVELDQEKAVLSKVEKSVSLSKKELALMEYLMLNHDQVLSRDKILARVWGDSFVEDGNLDNYIYFLRRRLRALGAKTKIQTIHGIGYKLIRNDERGPELCNEEKRHI